MSRTPEMVENDSAGRPQLTGSVEMPLIPASPETSSTPEKLLIVFAEVDE